MLRVRFILYFRNSQMLSKCCIYNVIQFLRKALRKLELSALTNQFYNYVESELINECEINCIQNLNKF